MSKSMQNSPEDLEDNLLADWVKGLPEPPPEVINATLHDLRHKTSTRPMIHSGTRWRWFLLAGMTACVALIIAGLAVGIMSGSDRGQISGAPTVVSNAVQPPTVTAIENSTLAPAQTPTPEPSPVTKSETPYLPATVPAAPTGLPQSAVSPAITTISATEKVLETPSPVSSVSTVQQTVSATTSKPAASARPDLPTVPPARPTRPAETTSPASTPTAPVPPATASPGQATPIVGVITIPASATTAASTQMFSGQISAINAGSLTLSNLTNTFILNSATRVRVNGQASTASALQVGDNVIIQAAFNAQGKLVALEISTTAKVLPKPISSPVK